MSERYVALRPMQVQTLTESGEPVLREDGTPVSREVARGEVVPEVRFWPSLHNWVAQKWVALERDFVPDAPAGGGAQPSPAEPALEPAAAAAELAPTDEAPASSGKRRKREAAAEAPAA